MSIRNRIVISIGSILKILLRTYESGNFLNKTGRIVWKYDISAVIKTVLF